MILLLSSSLSLSFFLLDQSIYLIYLSIHLSICARPCESAAPATKSGTDLVKVMRLPRNLYLALRKCAPARNLPLTLRNCCACHEIRTWLAKVSRLSRNLHPRVRKSCACHGTGAQQLTCPLHYESHMANSHSQSVAPDTFPDRSEPAANPRPGRGEPETAARRSRAEPELAFAKAICCARTLPSVSISFAVLLCISCLLALFHCTTLLFQLFVLRKFLT